MSPYIYCISTYRRGHGNNGPAGSALGTSSKKSGRINDAGLIERRNRGH